MSWCLNAEPAAKYFVASEKEGKELTGNKNVLWYLTLVLQLKNSPLNEIYGLIMVRGAIFQRLLCFFPVQVANKLMSISTSVECGCIYVVCMSSSPHFVFF